MRTTTLSGQWELRAVGTDEWLPATVPGGVYSDLRAAGEIPDPFVEDAECDVQWVAQTDWEYRRTVTVDDAFLDHEHVLVACEGLDTVATLWVNGIEVGATENMHVGQAFPVGDALDPGENVIRVVFESPVEYAAERAAAHPYEIPHTHYPVEQPGRPFVRKAQCQFGWDWGPCLPTMGIYREISLIAHSAPRIEYTTTDQDHGDDGVELSVTVGLDVPVAGEYTVGAAVADASTRERVTLDSGRQRVAVALTVEDPDLWWPRGYGDQPLSELWVGVGEADGDTTLDEATSTIGFREVDLRTDSDEVGRSFQIVVNGTPIYAKGANTVPIAPLYADVSESRYDHLLESAAAANMNTLRVWGGGYYEADYFYERCDELGILVWQDFMFACALYPADDAFLDSVEREVRYQVRRLADHPSIALWCANNENEQALYDWAADHDAHEAHLEDYRRLYTETVEATCREEDPSRPYWPGSPSSGPDTSDPSLETHGDVHAWDVWHESAPFEAYLQTEPRFVSEFGYQSFPSVETLLTVLDEGDCNPTAPLMEHHQRNPGGNERILTRLASQFRMPTAFEAFVYLSQLQQGLAMKTAIEHWRRCKPTTWGALYWQLNDLWPVASWASIEYDGQWKAQQYMARRQFAPVLVSFAPTHADEDENDEAGGAGAGAITAQTLWITSDRPDPIAGTVTLEILDIQTGTVAREETVDVDLAAQESTALVTIDRDDLSVDPTRVMLRATYDGPGDSFANVAVFEPYKRLDLPAADVETAVEGRTVTVSTDETALFVAVDPGPLRGYFSENYVHLAAGESRTLTFESADDRRTGLVEHRLESDLSVTHLRETY
ncbi:beta-mannosidase [Halococcoides cellulosivorans]|uniref:Beta-mannosidase B n=1 Tax=Halococcoides cellulosivorans TaxID=1679096 RepID=A0A2R4X2V4_9EURY|nr:glycoside hydrolase family 2 protein [Halococcoides cellulosivorans]AWB28121.1 glycoside hydrolase family 2 [Halococcoides cellulosivorans]